MVRKASRRSVVTLLAAALAGVTPAAMAQGFPSRPVKPAAKSNGYVSPVKPLPVAAMANGAGSDDWASF